MTTNGQVHNGGPTFPLTETDFNRNVPSMSLRDYFAGQAMQGTVCNGFIARAAKAAPAEIQNTKAIDAWTCELVARTSYEIADAMLAERAKGGAK